MRTKAKLPTVVVIAVMCLIGEVSVRADDVTTPPAQAPTQPDTTPPATTPPEVTQPIETPPMTLQPAENQQKDRWTFNSPLFMWIAGLSGNVTAHGRTANVDASASDILKHADFGFQGYFELAKPRYGFYALPIYMKLSDDAHGEILSVPVKAQLSSELWIVEFGAFYKVFDWQGDHPGSVAAVAGGRYWNVANGITLSSGPGSIHRSGSTELIDPIVGIRYEQYITTKLHLWFQGDVGGFDISNDQSRFSWSTLPLLGYDFTMPVIRKPSTVFAGYRVLSVQHTEGSGANKNAYHLNMEGAVIGLNVVLF